jgi:type IV pilus assembly protein PilC
VAKYKYSATDADGAIVTGVEEALTLTQARLALVRRQLDPVDVKEKKGLLAFELTKKKVPRKELMHFARQLAVFIRAGIPIIDGLETITEDAGNKVLRQSLTEMADALRGGATFADAAAAQPRAFPQMYLGILRSAELTGNLDVVLDQLADYIERDFEAKQKIKGALIYPGVILAMSMVSIVIMVTYVLPKFQDFFESLGADLPLMTRVVIGGAEFFKSWWWLIALIMLGVTIVLSVALRYERPKYIRDALLLKMPVLGMIAKDAILERFCRVLSAMVSAGVSLPEALTVTSEATNNRVFRRGLADAREAMMRGEGLAGPLAATGLFPPAARQMFRVGENTGSLERQMVTAAAYFDRELDYRLKKFTGLFEPAVLLVSGGIVGFIAIALVSTMYGIFMQVSV